MKFKEDKPTYFLHCEHVVLDKTSLRNTKYKKRVKSGVYKASFELLDFVQIDKSRVSKGGCHYDQYYLAKCPICLKKKG